MAFSITRARDLIQGVYRQSWRSAASLLSDISEHLGTIGATELGFIDGVTAGTATASKAIVVGSAKDIDTMAFGALTGADSSLGITGLAAAQGGAIVATGGTSSTAGNAGGAVSLVGGTPGATGVGGAANVTGGIGGATSGKGGAANISGGAGTNGNADGGSVVVTPGAANGSGLSGAIIQRGLVFKKQAAPVAKADSAGVLTAAEMIGGIVVHTVSTGRTLTTPTGAQISAGCPTDLAVGDSFDLSVITVGTGADDISTLTAGDANVTFVGNVTVGPDSATNNGYGTWRFRNTGTSTWIGYRIG